MKILKTNCTCGSCCKLDGPIEVREEIIYTDLALKIIKQQQSSYKGNCIIFKIMLSCDK